MLLAAILAILVGGHQGGCYCISIRGVELDSRRIRDDQVSGSDGVDRKHAVRGNRGRRGDHDALSTHPVESVIVLPSVVAAILALESNRIIRYQLPRQRGGGKERRSRTTSLRWDWQKRASAISTVAADMTKL